MIIPLTCQEAKQQYPKHLIKNVSEIESSRHVKILPEIDRILALTHAVPKRERVECLPANDRNSTW